MGRVRQRNPEAGQGLIPTVAGFAVVLVLLLLATQVAFDLYARTVVTSAALDAARSVADDRTADTLTATTQAQQRAVSALGDYGRVTAFHWMFDPGPDRPEVVALRVRFDLRGTRYSLVGPLILPGLNQFDRTVRARVERIVCHRDETCTVAR